MQCVTFYTIVGRLQPGVGVVNGAHTNFVATGKAQAEADTVFELEGGAKFVALNFGTGERGDTNTGFDVGLD
ncbi:hypothetical protein D3C85_1389100 [compost metagenome]